MFTPHRSFCATREQSRTFIRAPRTADVFFVGLIKVLGFLALRILRGDLDERFFTDLARALPYFRFELDISASNRAQRAEEGEGGKLMNAC